MSNSTAALEAMSPRVGELQGTGDWFTVTQDQINQFADVTHDHQFIHTDPSGPRPRPRSAGPSPTGS